MPKVKKTNEDEEDVIDEQETSDESSEDTKSSSSITFHFTDVNKKTKFSTRTFSEKMHGKDFKKLADEFEKTNTHIKPEYKETKEDKEEEARRVATYNRNILHPIFKKIVE